jgi:hypothetical protein
VTRVPNRESPPAVLLLLRERYREDGEVKNRTLANLPSWPEATVEALTAALKGKAPAAGLRGAFETSRSLPHGHVGAVLGTIRSLGVEELISPVPSRQRDLTVAMIIAAVIDSSSKLAIAYGRRAGIAWRRDEQKITDEAARDGIYGLRTSLPANTLGAGAAVESYVVESYKALENVERVFRGLQPPRTRLDPANFVLGCSILYRGRPNSAAALP